MADLPSGTVTFLFTDIEGSTPLWEQHFQAMRGAVARHHAILREAIAAQHGRVFNIAGDAFCAAFATASDALAAALAAQRALAQADWGSTPIRVRMGLHSGAAEVAEGDYRSGPTLNRVARVMSIASGGQILLSQITADLARRQLPDGVSLRDMGEHRLKGLADLERILQVVAPGLPADFPPLQSLGMVPNNLPVQLTSFVGREQEIAEARRLLTTTRLLTLTGSGGTGKTRLSLQLAAEVLDAYRDGVWLVELAPLADPAHIPQAAASALGVPEQPGRPILTTLTDHLRAKQLLLILDNCEHLIDACARLANTLLHAAPGVKVLASSREALGIAGETTYRVPSLECPDPRHYATAGLRGSSQHAAGVGAGLSGSSDHAPALGGQPRGLPLQQYAAVRLFVERAEAAKSDFRLTNANAPAVAQICYRLDGIPLAIELAAARIKVFSAEQIAARLTDRFQLLTGGSRTALPRQQTLRGTIDWSYSLLSEPERILLHRLSVFAGGWSFEAAEAVCAGEGITVHDVLDLLTRLVEKSLVAEAEKDGGARYRMLETIRQYARDKLLESGEGERIRALHLKFFVGLAEQFVPDEWGPRMVWWFSRLEAEIDNIRTGLEWSLEMRDAVSGLRLAGALMSFWQQRHPVEGLAYLHVILSQPEAAERGHQRSEALLCQGHIEYWQGNYASAQAAYEEALSIANEVGDEQKKAELIFRLGTARAARKDYVSARAYMTEALEVFRLAGNQRVFPTALTYFAEVSMSEGHLDEAKALYEESLVGLRLWGDITVIPLALRRLGQIALQRGEIEVAANYIRESLTLNLEHGERRGIAMCLAAVAAMFVAQGRSMDAVRLYGAVRTLLDSWQTKMLPIDQDRYEQSVATLRGQFDAATFDSAESAGRALTLDQAVALALEEPHS